MGDRGAPPAPTALKLLRGEKKSRINFDEPKAEDGIPDVPDSMEDVETLKVWAYTCNQLKLMGCISRADRDLLHAYCEAVVMHRKSSAYITERGVIMSDGTKNPAIQVQRDAAATMARLGRMFGLTPSARSEIRMTNLKPDSGTAERFLTA